jgi:hypothetical protein
MSMNNYKNFQCSKIIDQKLFTEKNSFRFQPSTHNNTSQLDKLLRKYSMNQRAIILNQIFNKIF